MPRSERTRRVRTVLAVALVLVGAAPQLAAQADAAAPPDAVPLLWRVQSDSATLYIYGSIHAAPPDAVPPPAIVRHAFTRSDTLVTEVVLGDDLTERLGAAMAARSELPAGTTLESFFDEAEWSSVRRWASGAGIPLESIESLQPWIVEMLVAETGGLPEGFTAENGLDTYFSAKATASRMPQAGLETLEEQLDALAGGRLEEQARSLLHAVEGAGEPGRIERLYEAWRSGDTPAIAAMIDEQYGRPELAGTYNRLFTMRNEAWMAPLVDHLSGTATTFVVVGAGHLVGRDSVIELLRDRGYAVTRVTRHEQISAAARSR